MAFTFYENALNSGMLLQPEEYYKELQQAFHNQVWDNTSAKIEIEEQDDFGELVFHKIEAWTNKAIGNTTTFMKNGQDFRQLIFKQIDRPLTRGLYYRFENNYWLADFVNPAEGLVSDLLVRRCNNYLKMIDPENGSIFSIPCVIDYDMTSPRIQVGSSIITPNNHATVFVQANKDTIRLFKYNTRFMLFNRPFKLDAFQDTLFRDLDMLEPKVLYLDLYLDEEHAKDDKLNKIAYNGTFDYAVSIDSEDLEITQDSSGKLESSVVLNGIETIRPTVWNSSNTDIVTITNTGEYQVLGKVGDTATITVSLDGNDEVNDSIQIVVVESQNLKPKIIINPTFDKIRQYETLEFKVEVSYGNKIIFPKNSGVSFAENEILLNNDYVSITNKENNTYQITGIKISKTPQTMFVSVKNTLPEFEQVEKFSIKICSLMG